jgi:hypothetical protein
MQYEDRVVCFLDILGFEAHVKATVGLDGSDDRKAIAELAAALADVQDVLDVHRAKLIDSKQVTQFSDSIVISFVVSEKSGVFWTLLELLWVQIGLLLRGIICRGAVSREKLVHTASFVFGPALVEAYKWESKAALYPRIILSESLIELAGEHPSFHHTPEMEKDFVHDLIAIDSDGMYFIDYFQNAQSELDDPEYDFPMYLNKAAEVIRNGLSEEDPAIRIKYQWMRERYNQLVQGIQKHLSDLSDRDIRDAYQSLPIL